MTTENVRRVPGDESRGNGPVRRWLLSRPADVIDFFVYVVVLNLAVEYLPAVISEGFTLSLLTALLLKVTLEVVLLAKGRLMTRLKGATTQSARAVAVLLLWIVAAGSKFVVLLLVDLAFGDSVSLGGFIPVTLLILALLASRSGVRRLLFGIPPQPAG